MQIQKQTQPVSLARLAVILGLALSAAMLLHVLPALSGNGQNRPAQRQSSPASQRAVAALSPYVDVHSHLDETNVDGSMQSAIDSMPVENLARIVFMPSPFTVADANRFDIERLHAQHRVNLARDVRGELAKVLRRFNGGLGFGRRKRTEHQSCHLE